MIIDATRYEPPDLAPGWSVEDPIWYYGAPISAVIIDQNAIKLSIRPSEKLGGNVSVKAITNPFFSLVNSLKTVSNWEAKNSCSFHVVNHDQQLFLSGCWPRHKITTERLAIQQPIRYAKRLISQELRRLNIAHGTIVLGRTPPSSQILAEHRSRKLATLLTIMLNESDNVIANSVFKTLGYHRFQHGNFKSGARAVQAILAEKINLSFEKMILVDGAGGSRYNLLSPKHIAELLVKMFHHPSFATFIRLLPDLKKNPYYRHFDELRLLPDGVKVKTGTMSGVANLSGYLRVKGQRPLVFSILYNNLLSTPENAKAINEARKRQLQLIRLVLRQQTFKHKDVVKTPEPDQQ